MANVRTKNGGRKGTREYWEDTWNRAAEFPHTFLFPQLLWYWDFYCQHDLLSLCFGKLFTENCYALHWVELAYYNSSHCSTTLVISCWAVMATRRRFIAIVDASTCKYIQMLLQMNMNFWVHFCKWMHRSFARFCMILYMNVRSALHREELISATDSFAKINTVGKGVMGVKFLMQRTWGELG